MKFYPSLVIALILFQAIDGKQLKPKKRKPSLRATGCSYDLATSSPTYLPHFIDTNNIMIQPILQGTSRILNLNEGQQFTIACEGTGNYLNVTGKQVNTATCVSGSIQVGTQLYALNTLGCRSAIKETIKETGSCLGGSRIEVGWQVGTTFLNQITVCHNKTTANSLYAIDSINGLSINADDQANTRPSFRKGGYYTGIDVDTAYSQVGQTATVGKIVGSSTLAAQYIDVSKSYYFARGHFSPDGDFIDAPSQDATYYYFNVAPQWQSFNNGNWKALELATRNQAATRGRNFTTFTGGYGLLTLPDINGVQQPIYLAFDANNNGLIPVPKYYWKIVKDPLLQSAVAFVGINNPHIGAVTTSDILCPDICNQIPWVTWNRSSISSGYMICCSVADLKAKIPYIPVDGTEPLLL